MGLAMPSELELEIQQHLKQYLSGAESLTDFEDWFVPLLWDIDEEDDHTRDLAGRVHVLLSEFSRGDRSLGELRDKLSGTIRTTVA
jgi:hypothetical protein